MNKIEKLKKISEAGTSGPFQHIHISDGIEEILKLNDDHVYIPVATCLGYSDAVKIIQALNHFDALLKVVEAAKEASEIIQKYKILARADSHSLRLRKALEKLEAIE